MLLKGAVEEIIVDLSHSLGDAWVNLYMNTNRVLPPKFKKTSSQLFLNVNTCYKPSIYPVLILENNLLHWTLDFSSHTRYLSLLIFCFSFDLARNLPLQRFVRKILGGFGSLTSPSVIIEAMTNTFLGWRPELCLNAISDAAYSHSQILNLCIESLYFGWLGWCWTRTWLLLFECPQTWALEV